MAINAERDRLSHGGPPVSADTTQSGAGPTLAGASGSASFIELEPCEQCGRVIGCECTEPDPPLAGRSGSVLAGIPAPTLAQQVAQLEYQRDQLNQLLGELIATCLVNLHSGSIKCDDPMFRQYVEARSSLRMQLLGEVVALSSNATNQQTT